MNMKRILILTTVILATVYSVQAQITPEFFSFNNRAVELQKRAKRVTVDRDINKNKFIYKGEWMTGITASYYTFSATDTEYLLFFDNIDASFGMTTVKPFFAYFYSDNHAVGARLGYSYTNGTLDSARIDLGEESDIQISIPYIHNLGRYYTGAIFHRSYVGLDRNGHFGLFAEVELSATGGSGVFEFDSDESKIYAKSDKTSVELAFNPGVSVFLMDNVSASMSLEFGGLGYTNIKQYDEQGEEIGERNYSKMNFKFNALAINLGVTVHIW